MLDLIRKDYQHNKCRSKYCNYKLKGGIAIWIPSLLPVKRRILIMSRNYVEMTNQKLDRSDVRSATHKQNI